MKVTGHRIRALRERKGLTQIQLAAMLHINNSVLSRIESGRRPIDDELLIRCADLFNTSADYLLGRIDRVEETYTTYHTEQESREQQFWEKLRRTAFFDGDKELSDEEKELMMESLMNAALNAKKLISRTAKG